MVRAVLGGLGGLEGLSSKTAFGGAIVESVFGVGIMSAIRSLVRIFK